MPLGPDEIILDCSEPEVIKFAGDCYIKVRDVTDEEGFKSDASGSYEDCQECQDDPGGGFQLTNCSSPSDQLVVSATALPGATNGQVYRLTHSGQLKCYEVTATDQVGPYDTIAGPVLESDCNACESTLPSSEGSSSEQGSSSSGGLVERWIKCPNEPDVGQPALIYFNSPNGEFPTTATILNDASQVCYSFSNTEPGVESINPLLFTASPDSPTAQVDNCDWCIFDNVRFEEITEQVACTPDIVMTKANWALTNPTPYSDVIDHNGKCYQFKEMTDDAATVAGVKDSHLSDCDCYTDQTYNVKWQACAGKQGDGPAYIVRAWAYNPSASITLNGGCYKRPGAVVGDAAWCAAATCEDETVESIGPWTWDDCDACEPEQGSSGDGGGTGPGGPGGGGSNSSDSDTIIPGDSDEPIGSLSEPLVPESDPSPTSSQLSSAPASSTAPSSSEAGVCEGVTCPTVNGIVDPPSIKLTITSVDANLPKTWCGKTWVKSFAGGGPEFLGANEERSGEAQCVCPTFYDKKPYQTAPTFQFGSHHWRIGTTGNKQLWVVAYLGGPAKFFKATMANGPTYFYASNNTFSTTEFSNNIATNNIVLPTTAALTYPQPLIQDSQFGQVTTTSGVVFKWARGLNW